MEQISREPFEMRLVARILRWRLLVALLICLVALLTEIGEINDTPGPFDLLSLLEFDVFILALVLPVLVWVMLTLVARVLTQRAHNEEFLNQYRRFSQQLARCYGLEELVKFVTNFPATLLSGTRTALYLYDRRLARFEFVRQSEAAGTHAEERRLRDCGACPFSEWPNATLPGRMFRCQPTQDQEPNTLCLALSHELNFVGRLLLAGPAGRSLPPESVNFLEAAAAELALALALSRANAERLEQTALAAQRGARQQIAYALHDSLAQQVGYLHLNLDRLSAEESLPADRQLRAELEQMRSVAGDVYDQIRGTLAILRSADGVELPLGIDQLVQTIQAASRLEIDFQIEGDRRPIPATLAQQTLSFVRECLNNVVKHAGARRVEIKLHYWPDRYQISVTDDGSGFEIAAAPQVGHYGLSMLAEQIHELQGQLEVASGVGRGTQVCINLPFQPMAYSQPGLAGRLEQDWAERN